VVDALTPDPSSAAICPMEDNLIPLADLVEVFHRSKSTLYRWAAAGYIPTRKIGSTVYMHRIDVDRYTANRVRIDEELDRRRTEHGRILDAETMSLLVNALQDALAALRAARSSSGRDEGE
jgi:Helix-turn-helix domain